MVVGEKGVRIRVERVCGFCVLGDLGYGLMGCWIEMYSVE